MSITKTLAQFEQEMKEAAEKVDATMNNPLSDDETIKKAKDTLKGAVAAYNKKAAEDFYQDMATEHGEFAVREAIRTLYVPKSVKASTKKSKKTGKFSTAINPCDIRINLMDMMTKIGSEGFFPDAKWFGAVQRLAFIMAANLNKELAAENSEFGHILKAAGQAFEFAPDANFTSNRSCKKAMQKTIDMILYEEDPEKGDGVDNKYKINSAWLEYVNDLLCEEGDRPDEVVMRNSDKMADLVLNVLWMQLNGKKPKLVVG